ncbi:hypothetical protein R75461_07775 [Paraburkholderia nemoris]|uniref:DUF3563 family protein n=1 Tax=Paraburkholderia nemoris TaxID=2793076 RepID=UPI00190CEB3B|nr:MULTISPECIES: DUF3563 family protein [Paraburkholderia]MBK3786526.1 DUF3563 domain-containing protein [Paraburkholderia aspalathi]CAE6857141.1 hypothetical protein R75461_07775 [Paraburkholderia nemoris]
MSSTGTTNLEYVVWKYLFSKLAKRLESAEYQRRDAYLGASSNVLDLERRMRALETGPHIGSDLDFESRVRLAECVGLLAGVSRDHRP